METYKNHGSASGCRPASCRNGILGLGQFTEILVILSQTLHQHHIVGHRGLINTGKTEKDKLADGSNPHNNFAEVKKEAGYSEKGRAVLN